MKIKLLMAGLLISTISMAQQNTGAPDTTVAASTQKKYHIKPVTYIVPAALISYGFLALEAKPLIQLNQNIQTNIWVNHPHGITHIDDYTWMLPAISVYALNLAGVKGQHNFLDRSAILGMSYLISSAVVIPTKRLTNERRPDASNNYSFPSGHTTQAFVAAEFLRMEYRDQSPWYGIAGYAVAATTGYLRLYNNKHWLSDVFAGAGIGILSVQASYWLYPKIKQSFSSKKQRNALILPYYNGKQAGLTMVYLLK